MLRSLRSSAKYIAIVFVTIPFVLWLATAQVSSILGPSGNVVLRVNGREYQVNEYQQRVQVATEQYRQQTGAAPMTREDEQQIGDQVIHQMVQETLLQQESRRRGIRVRDDEVRW